MWLFTLLDKWANYRLKRHQMTLEAATAPYRAIETAIDRLVASSTANSDILKKWMEQFTVKAETQTSTVREFDEWLAEHNREKDQLPPPSNDEWQAIDIEQIQRELQQQLD